MLKVRKIRKGFSLMEMIVVILILAILAAIGIGAGTKQVANARIQETSSFLQTMDSNIEEAIMDMGFMDSAIFDSLETAADWASADSDTQSAVENYLEEMQDIYLPCGFDYATMALIKDSGYVGFSVEPTVVQDAWKQNYTFYYMYSESEDTYRIVVASMGPNNFPSDKASIGYLTAGTDDSWDDDIVIIMISRV